jgi:Bacterial Ig domain
VFLVNQNFTLEATASSTDSTIKYVAYYSNGSFLNSASSSPYKVTTADEAAETLTLTAVAVAKNGNTATSAPVTITVVQDVAPTVSITSPSDGTVYDAKPTVVIDASASSEYSTISEVDFYQGSTLLKADKTVPYSYSWSKPAAGTYTLTAVAIDAQGLSTTSAPVPITVNP